MRHARIIVAALLLVAGHALADPTATGKQTVSDVSNLPATARDVDGTSVSRKVKDRFEHLVDHTAGIVNVKSYGAKGDGVTNDQPAIQAAIDAASAFGSTVLLPAGTYSVAPATVGTDEAGALTWAFSMRSNMHLRGEPGAVLKMADNQSTDASPKALAMFHTSGVLSNVSFRNIAMDMNGANNRISPSRGSGTFNRFNFAAISVSGTPGGVAARMSDVTIEDCQFLNTPGVSSIVMAQSNTPGITLGAHWALRRNRFWNNGLDSDDHSSVFGWADDVEADANTFGSDTQVGTVPHTGCLCGYEVHGARHKFTRNSVTNCYRGMWVASNLTSPANDILIQGNTFRTMFMGVDVFRESSALSAIYDVRILDNSFTFDDSSLGYLPSANYKSGVQIGAMYAVSQFIVRGNQVRKAGTTIGGSVVSVFTQAVAGQAHDGITIEGNYGLGMSQGVSLVTTAAAGLGRLAVRNNTFDSLTPSTLFTIPQGIATSGASAVDDLALDGNRVIDARGTPLCQYGVYIGAPVTTLTLGAQSYKGNTVADWYESATITNRKGNGWPAAASATWTPTFKAGAATVSVGNGSVVGRYVIVGDLVTVSAVLVVGSTTSFGAGGSLALTVPFASAVSGMHYLGSWRIWDTSAGTFTATGPANLDGTSSDATLVVSGGTLANQNAPVLLATGDNVTVQITYMK